MRICRPTGATGPRPDRNSNQHPRGLPLLASPEGVVVFPHRIVDHRHPFPLGEPSGPPGANRVLGIRSPRGPPLPPGPASGPSRGGGGALHGWPSPAAVANWQTEEPPLHPASGRCGISTPVPRRQGEGGLRVASDWWRFIPLEHGGGTARPACPAPRESGHQACPQCGPSRHLGGRSPVGKPCRRPPGPPPSPRSLPPPRPPRHPGPLEAGV